MSDVITNYEEPDKGTVDEPKKQNNTEIPLVCGNPGEPLNLTRFPKVEQFLVGILQLFRDCAINSLTGYYDGMPVFSFMTSYGDQLDDFEYKGAVAAFIFTPWPMLPIIGQAYHCKAWLEWIGADRGKLKTQIVMVCFNDERGVITARETK